MKLPMAYYEQINGAIMARQIPEHAFSYTKKRGWIYINHLPTTLHFSFYRKKSVVISDQNHQWENREVFKVKTSRGRIEEKENWEDVMKSLVSWLKSIPSQ